MLFWTKEEFDKFISVVDNPTHKAIFMFLFYTGRRKGEVLALNKNDIKKNEIIFSKTYTRKTLDGVPYKITTTKNEKIGKTPICKPLAELISMHEFDAPFAFGGKNPIHENTIAHAFERYIEKADVKKIRMHDLRHSFVSMLIHLGANLTVVADLIGDTLEQVTKTYAHLYEEDKQKIIARIE
jgi:integrase